MEFLQIFLTGGTVDKVYFDAKSDYEIGEPQVDHIFRRVGVTFENALEILFRKDSLEITDEDRSSIETAVR